MDALVNLYKPRFMTPKECLECFVLQNPEYAGVSATYAGRLDPMAEGVLPILFGEAVHRKEMVSGLRKEYALHILFGFATDTGDMLGKLEHATPARTTLSLPLASLLSAVQSCVGTHTQKYPRYSSKTVAGKPLHEYARKGEEVMRPYRDIEIYSIKIASFGECLEKDITSLVEEMCTRVKGEFRQEEIRATWQEELRKHPNSKFPLVTLTVECSSGTYMRTLAEEIGKKCSLPALAYHIARTKVGDMHSEDARHIC